MQLIQFEMDLKQMPLGNPWWGRGQLTKVVIFFVAITAFLL